MTAPGTRDFVLEDGPATSTGVLAASEFSSGQIIAERYRVERLLGMGGMGVVYLAHDLQLDVPVALKLLRPELASRPDAFERFRQELLLARQVSSPHVVRIHDLVQHGAAWLISMDYVAGRSLESLLDERGTLDVDTALQITRQLALGLAAAHARGVVHRDLKPANILMTEQGDALITDFGVARSAGATGITVSGVVIGTPEYLSPELARNGPYASKDEDDAHPRISYAAANGTRMWREIDDPSTEEAIPLAQNGQRSVRWVEGERALIYVAPVNGLNQVHRYDVDSKQLTQLTFDDGAKDLKSVPWMWRAPEFGGGSTVTMAKGDVGGG